MTTTLEKPPGTDAPRRSRALVWTGGVIGAVIVLGSAWSVVGQLLWFDTEPTTATATYATRPVVELVADGDVDVRTGGADVVVEHTDRTALGKVSYSADATDDRLTIRNQCSWYSSCTASLAVSVPAGTEVVVRARDGDVTAKGLGAALDVDARDGHVSVADLGGGLTVRATDTAVDVRSVRGDVEVKASDGSVDVEDVAGSLTVRARDGRVTASAVAGDVDISATDADVTVYGTGEPVALDIRAVDGRETIDAPTDPGADRHVRISTRDGDATYRGPR